ncbi:MAG TPA: dipeptidase [Thermoanaerobaculia bacterium]|jgi:membrane dipeptidase
MRRLAALLLIFALPLSAATKKTTAHRSITVDTHADTPTEYLAHPFNLATRNSTGMFDYVRMKEGGLDTEFLVAYVPAKYANNGAAAFCMKIMETIHEMVDHYPQWVRFATSTSDIEKTVRNGKRAILIGIEGGHAIEDSLDLLRAFYRFGARYMTLTHTNSNNWADSSGDEPKHNGLTQFGRDVVREMNRLGMLVDISHVSDKTFYDVIDTTKAPVIASHSSARALADHKRNMTDDMLRAVSKNNGVVMVNFYPVFLSTETAQAAAERDKRLEPQIDALKKEYGQDTPEYDKARKQLMDANPLPKVSWTRIVDHIDHIVHVAGVDHAGLGSDFDGISITPVGMEDVSDIPKIRAELKRRGYSDADVRKIMGENFMRVFAAVERISHEMQKQPAAAE